MALRRSVPEGLIDFFPGFLDRTFWIDGVFDVVRCAVDAFADFFRRPLFATGSHGRDYGQEDGECQECGFHGMFSGDQIFPSRTRMITMTRMRPRPPLGP